MQKRTAFTALILAFTSVISGCTPLIVGGGAAVVADSIVEDREGGDGLF